MSVSSRLLPLGMVVVGAFVAAALFMQAKPLPIWVNFGFIVTVMIVYAGLFLFNLALIFGVVWRVMVPPAPEYDSSYWMCKWFPAVSDRVKGWRTVRWLDAFVVGAWAMVLVGLLPATLFPMPVLEVTGGGAAFWDGIWFGVMLFVGLPVCWYCVIGAALEERGRLERRVARWADLGPF